MIAGRPLAPDGLLALAAVGLLRGLPKGLSDELARLVALQPVDDPRQCLARLAAKRPLKDPCGRPTGVGPAPAARFLRRLGRRARVLQSLPERDDVMMSPVPGEVHQ